ncbi:MAG TPA: immunoglobulin domain-containing protein [Candidatus Limnocylindria bacterium]|jgi:uncharacterized delta-60 repeat protein|nr:immunoglobulin domain-containing protein [Candidatus Limnocylindria bacterium]
MKYIPMGLRLATVSLAIAFAPARLVAQPTTVDPDFTPGGGTASIQKLVIQTDGRVLVAGSFPTYNNVAAAPPGLVRLLANGTIDPSFNLGTGFIGQTLIIPGVFTNVSPAIINGMVETPAGILVGGSFEKANGLAHTNLVRLQANGTVDEAFHVDTDGTVGALLRLADGRIVVGGSFKKFQGANRIQLAILKADGTLDAQFIPNWGSLIPGTVRALAVQSDGKIVVGGSMLAFAPGLVSKIAARFNTDGTLDDTFKTPTAAFTVESASSLVVQSTGKILLAGGFSKINGETHHAIVRLNTDGSVDSSWPGTGIGNNGGESVDALALASDGRVLLGGKLDSYNGIAQPGLARLSADGVLDTTFTKPAGSTTYWVSTLAEQTDGKILIGGVFTLGTSVDSTKILLRLLTKPVGPPPKPTITQQPIALTVNLGATADFLVKATGTPPLNYQWQFNEKSIAFHNDPTFHIPVTKTDDIGGYRVIVSNAGGAVTSSVATLNLILPAHILLPPVSRTVEVSNRVTFEVTVTGTEPIVFQWRKNGTNISKATNRVFEIMSAALADAGGYSVVVSNAAGGETSGPAQLTVQPPVLRIAQGPLSQVVTLPNTNLTAAVLANRKLCLTIAGALPPWIGSGSYCITFKTNSFSSPANGALAGASAGSFAVALGTAPPATLIQFDPFFPDGSGATLTLLADGIYEFNHANLVADQNGHWTLDPPFVPQVGPTVKFSVTATGTPPFLYQWLKNGHSINGATGSELVITNVQSGDLASYTVEVRSGAQLATSDPAILSEATAATGRLDFSVSKGVLLLTWSPGDKLESSATLAPASWQAVAGAVSPFSPVQTGAKAYFRVVPK